MTRSDLILRVSEIYPYMNIRNVDRVVSIVIGKMIEALKDGKRVELRGFGSFSIKERDSSERRNPKTGEKVIIKPKKVPYFKAGKQLKSLINGQIAFDGN